MSGNSFQQQVINVAEDLAQSVTAPLLGFLWSWIKRIIPLFLVLVVVISLALSGYTFFRQQRDRSLKFFVPSGGGSGADQVDLIEAQLREQRDFWGPNYLVTEVATGGSLENLRNVKRDQEGDVIGLAVDGLSLDKNDKKDIYTLVPLQWCYLHFVIRVNSLINIGFKPEELKARGELPVTLTEWAAKYRLAKTNGSITSDNNKWPVRIYLGQANSGTRHLAELVLTNAKIKPSELDPSYYISDVTEIPEQLSRKHIDGAFMLEPLHSDLMDPIAALDDHYTLISLDNTKDLLPNNKFIVPSKIHCYTYSFTQPYIQNNKHSDDIDVSHLGEVDSLATRRLIVASSKMSDADAYRVANFIQSSIPNDEISRPDKNNRWSGPEDDGKDHPPSYDLHPGVVLDLKNEPGINWFGRHVSWLGPLLLAMTISLITELKNRIPGWLDGHRAPIPPKGSDSERDQTPKPVAPLADKAQPFGATPKEQPTEYAAIESQLDILYDELMASYDRNERPLKAEMTAWDQRLDFWMRHVRPLRREGKLSRNDVEALHGTASKLRQMLDVLREPAVAAATDSVGTKEQSTDDIGKTRENPR